NHHHGHAEAGAQHHDFSSLFIRQAAPYGRHHKGGQEIDSKNHPRPHLVLFRVGDAHLLQVKRQKRDDHRHGAHDEELGSHQNVQVPTPQFHNRSLTPPPVSLFAVISQNEISKEKSCPLLTGQPGDENPASIKLGDAIPTVWRRFPSPTPAGENVPPE